MILAVPLDERGSMPFFSRWYQGLERYELSCPAFMYVTAYQAHVIGTCEESGFLVLARATLAHVGVRQRPFLSQAQSNTCFDAFDCLSFHADISNTFFFRNVRGGFTPELGWRLCVPQNHTCTAKPSAVIRKVGREAPKVSLDVCCQFSEIPAD